MPSDNDPIIKLLFAPRPATQATLSMTSVAFEFSFDSHYDVLGVPRNATPDEIDIAKFTLRRHYDGPARVGDPVAALRLRLITTAQEVLAKPDKRKEYDRRPDAAFLSIQEPFEDEQLDWENGLVLIRELALDAADHLLSPDDIAAPARPNAMLEQLLEQ